jgi:hypothetical protein
MLHEAPDGIGHLIQLYMFFYTLLLLLLLLVACSCCARHLLCTLRSLCLILRQLSLPGCQLSIQLSSSLCQPVV